MFPNLNFIKSALATAILCFGGSAFAELLKCEVKSGGLSYFESTDKVRKDSCVTEAVSVTNGSGKSIKKSYSNPNFDKTITVSSTQVKQTCGGSGGTITVNGKVFHLDPALICKKYSKKPGTIAIGKPVFKPKLYKVNSEFRKKVSAFVFKMSTKYNMEPEFIHAIISAESAYNPNAKSHAGAQGLMQLMPFTAKRFGVTNPYNPYQNIEAGTKYLKKLYDEFGTLSLAAAGYNAGEGSVRKYNNKIPPYKETRRYVPKVLAYYKRYKANPSLISGY